MDQFRTLEADILQAELKVQELQQLGVQQELKFKEAEIHRQKRMTKELGGENAIREQLSILFRRIEQLHSNVEFLQGHCQEALERATELLGQLTQSTAMKWPHGSLVPRRSREQTRAEAKHDAVGSLKTVADTLDKVLRAYEKFAANCVEWCEQVENVLNQNRLRVRPEKLLKYVHNDDRSDMKFRQRLLTIVAGMLESLKEQPLLEFPEEDEANLNLRALLSCLGTQQAHGRWRLTNRHWDFLSALYQMNLSAAKDILGNLGITDEAREHARTRFAHMTA